VYRVNSKSGGFSKLREETKVCATSREMISGTDKTKQDLPTVISQPLTKFNWENSRNSNVTKLCCNSHLMPKTIPLQSALTCSQREFLLHNTALVIELKFWIILIKSNETTRRTPLSYSHLSSSILAPFVIMTASTLANYDRFRSDGFILINLIRRN
jgi:hypothetical protein